MPLRYGCPWAAMPSTPSLRTSNRSTACDPHHKRTVRGILCDGRVRLDPQSPLSEISIVEGPHQLSDDVLIRSADDSFRTKLWALAILERVALHTTVECCGRLLMG